LKEQRVVHLTSEEADKRRYLEDIVGIDLINILKKGFKFSGPWEGSEWTMNKRVGHLVSQSQQISLQ
jgi:hypothetical protein